MERLVRQRFLYLENFFLIFKKEIIIEWLKTTKHLVRVEVLRKV